ncbi:hypothetical protein [Dyadobacter bucti]|uniref:hypothetical protein n=1 Tax=Dyadobacter bucti TaxID=2572203 RepID=UPI001109DA0A|nr:hypothetical protein [Dyadobacter bucti]
MNELERINKTVDQNPSLKSTEKLTSIEVYDKYGAMAYGIILQIVPQPHLAQEILVNVFSSPQLQLCNSYPFTFAVCIIKLARMKAMETKGKLLGIAPEKRDLGIYEGERSPGLVFDLAFCQGYTPEEVAEKLQMSKSEVLRAFHEFFKSYAITNAAKL